MNNESTTELENRLSNLSWTDLKRTAKNEFNYAVPREATREDIVKMLIKMHVDPNISKRVTDINSPIEPGWARIKLHTHDRASGKDNVVLNVNDGKPFIIHRGRVVDIPIKHMEALRTAVNDLVLPDKAELKDGVDIFSITSDEENDYAFDLIGYTPGPDPRPTALERQLKARADERRKKARQFGYNWLRDKKYRELMKLPSGQDAVPSV